MIYPTDVQGAEYFDSLSRVMYADDMLGIKALQHYLMKYVDCKDFGLGQKFPTTAINQQLIMENFTPLNYW